MLFLYKRNNALHPTAQSEEDFGKLPSEKVYRCDVKQPRNLSHHRLYWGLVSILVEHAPGTRNKDQIHEAIKLGVGHYTIERCRLDTGEIVDHYRTRETSFATMDQAEFAEFFERVLDFTAQHIMPGIGSDKLEQQVRQLVDI